MFRDSLVLLLLAYPLTASPVQDTQKEKCMIVRGNRAFDSVAAIREGSYQSSSRKRQQVRYLLMCQGVCMCVWQDVELRSSDTESTDGEIRRAAVGGSSGSAQQRIWVICEMELWRQQQYASLERVFALSTSSLLSLSSVRVRARRCRRVKKADDCEFQTSAKQLRGEFQVSMYVRGTSCSTYMQCRTVFGKRRV